MRLPQSFFARDTLDVARDLIGTCLVHRAGRSWIVGQITETEAYCGPHDLACHAAKGRTARTEVMFGPAGFWYVYLIYGMYYCLNVVTEHEDFPAAVLIRGVRPLEGIAPGVKTDGPGKLCRAFGIDKATNRTPGFGRAAHLWVEQRDVPLPPGTLESTPRIGIAYAGEYVDKPWRFLWKCSR